MLESPSPEQLNEAVLSVKAEISRRHVDYLKGNLEVVEKTFPQIVADARKLWSALQQDGLEDLADVQEDSGPEEPRFFMDCLVDPETVFDFPTEDQKEIVRIIKDSPNRAIYREIDQRYFGRNTPVEGEEKAASGIEDLFNDSFLMVRELSLLGNPPNK